MTQNQDVITVIIPVFNAEKYLHECLNSVLNQTYTSLEIICVNDGSADASMQILNGYAQKDNRVKIIDKKINESLPQARKTGFENSTGKYIFFVDSDDFIEPDLLKKMHNYSISGDYDMVICGYYQYSKNSRIIKQPQKLSDNKQSRIKDGIFGFGNVKQVWNKFVKRKIYEKVIFGPRNFGEDCLISTQLFYYAEKISYLNEPLYHFRWSDSSITRDATLKQKRYEGRKANYEDIISFCKEKYGENLNIFEPELSERMAWIESYSPNNSFFKRRVKPMTIGIKQVFRKIRINGISSTWNSLKNGIAYFIFDYKVNRK